MKKDWFFHVGGNVCDVRVAGVLTRDGKLLLQREKDGYEYALPGGHVQIGETLEEALIREYREEMGADIACERMLWSEECFWEWNGRSTHNFSFYYLLSLRDDSPVPAKSGPAPHKDNENILLEWLSLEDIHSVTIYPEFLKTEINHLDAPIRHFVSKR